MALRQATILIRDRQTTGGALPTNALMGEPFVNLFDGVLKFSGVTGGVYEPSDVASVFEVGSTLYNSRITNRLNINDNLIISGDTGIISTYAGESGTSLSGKFLSGTTDGFVLGNISEIQGVTTRVQPGNNTFTGGTPDLPTVNIVASPSFEDLNVSGDSEFTGNVDITTGNLDVVNGEIQSGGTDLYNIFVTENTDDITRVQEGSNIVTGGTPNNPIINVVDSPSFNNISFSGIAEGGDLSVNELSATTIYSGQTDLYDIFLTSGDVSGSTVSAGSNVNVDQTGVNFEVSVVPSPSFEDLNVSGDSEFTGNVDITTGNLDVVNGEIQSGGTDLYNIFVTENTDDITRVQEGNNIVTGGTPNEPIINVVDSPNFAGLVSATGFTDSSLTEGRVVFAGTSGRLEDQASFTYDSGTNTLNTNNITVGFPGKTGTTATIFGDVLIIGDAITGFTSDLYIEDNHIELNFNPTASTETTSLTAGFTIQDGSGIAGTDVFFDIRGIAAGLGNRGFATNLNDIFIRDSGADPENPDGVRVLAEFDTIDGGTW